MDELRLFLPKSLLTPPTLAIKNQFLDWIDVPDSDSVTKHIGEALWNHEVTPESWQVARLSPAVYIYHEERTGWKIIAKFYQSKTGRDAIHHAEREFQRTQFAWECMRSDQELRSAQPLGLCDGVLFLEYVDGLTLGDKIAIRRSQPGEILRSLQTVGKLLAKLHTSGIQLEIPPDFGPAADYAYKLVDNLARHGVLQKHLNARNGLGRSIEKWIEDKLMWNFQQTLNHGDATTANFIFSLNGRVVAIDWERSDFADPAADLGRLMAEVTHSVNQYGGNYEEGFEIANVLATAYCNELQTGWDQDILLKRARFYQASSTLRIARNGWLSRQDRLDLVLQAFALLSK